MELFHCTGVVALFCQRHTWLKTSSRKRFHHVSLWPRSHNVSKVDKTLYLHQLSLLGANIFLQIVGKYMNAELIQYPRWYSGISTELYSKLTWNICVFKVNGAPFSWTLNKTPWHNMVRFRYLVAPLWIATRFAWDNLTWLQLLLYAMKRSYTKAL